MTTQATRRVNVPLGDRAYTIWIGHGVLNRVGDHCRRMNLTGPCAVITDRNVSTHYAGAVMESLRRARLDPVLIVVPAGETAKKLKNVERCYDQLAQQRIERKSFVLALGGGVVGDLAGFVAATYLRGVDFVQAPTTLLAQVDSSVGGKVGVNLKSGKNLVGAFYQPRGVLCDLGTLQTLPDREFRAGLAEVIKYGIIYDRRLFDRLEKQLPEILARDRSVLTAVVERCCAIKAEVVAQDERESGLRAILNFGHTIGHALEAISRYGRYLHGEAISIGQVAAARLSTRLSALPESESERIERLFERAGLPTRLRLNRSVTEKLAGAMRLDKKVTGGEVKFVLARRIGDVRPGWDVPASLINEMLD